MAIMRTVNDILNEALQLPERERADLADMLFASVEDRASVEEAWLQEAERRLEEIDRGEVKMVPWEEVQAHLKSARKH
jgi:putative addiction module component (TIGR02574 family)